ncbi:MAG: ExbD/TolR family protein [Thiobacillus sp.]
MRARARAARDCSGSPPGAAGSAAARQTPQPEVHIRADGELAYGNVARIMADAVQAGLTRLGFVADPRTTP